MKRFSRTIVAVALFGALAACDDSNEPGSPMIGLSTQSVAVVGVEGGATPGTAVISVTNDGTGSLTGLAASITYEAGQPTGWLVASLDETTAPASLALTATPGTLARGQYGASVALAATGVSNSPQSVAVVFVVNDPAQAWASVHVRDSGTCARMPVGAAFCWGAGDMGQIGDGLATFRLVPTAVLGGMTSTGMTVGQEHTCALDAAGTAYCWGANDAGQLGDGSTTNRREPVQVTATVALASVTAGGRHTCGLTAAGEAFCWGSNDAGQLGDSSTARRLTPTAVLGGLTFTSLTAGAGHTCGLTAVGEAYCWGDNTAGQLGDDTRGRRLTPTAVAGALVFDELAAGSVHTCGLTAAGEAYCWGSNDFGQLGDGTVVKRQIPTATIGGFTFAHLATDAGGQHTCALDGAGSAYCWGSNSAGQLGDGTRTNRLVPTAVAGGLTFTNLSGGGSHTCGVATAAGAAYCWGANTTGQLGDGTRVDRLMPVEVQQP